jgi:hypothetical protein
VFRGIRALPQRHKRIKGRGFITCQYDGPQPGMVTKGMCHDSLMEYSSALFACLDQLLFSFHRDIRIAS